MKRRAKPNQAFAYHGTLSKHLESIQNNGLIPGAWGEYRDAYSEYDDGYHLFFTDDANRAYWGKARDLLRFPWPVDAKPDKNKYGRYLPHQFVSKLPVPAAEIEVMVDEEWQPMRRGVKNNPAVEQHDRYEVSVEQVPVRKRRDPHPDPSRRFDAGGYQVVRALFPAHGGPVSTEVFVKEYEPDGTPWHWMYFNDAISAAHEIAKAASATTPLPVPVMSHGRCFAQWVGGQAEECVGRYARPNPGFAQWDRHELHVSAEEPHPSQGGGYVSYFVTHVRFPAYGAAPEKVAVLGPFAYPSLAGMTARRMGADLQKADPKNPRPKMIVVISGSQKRPPSSYLIFPGLASGLDPGPHYAPATTAVTP